MQYANLAGKLRCDDQLIDDPRPRLRAVEDAALKLVQAIERYHDLTGETDCDVRAALAHVKELL